MAESNAGDDATVVSGAMKTEYSSNARSKCQLCRTKIAKGSWRLQIAIADPYHPHSDGRPRINWGSCHTSCYLENVTHPVNLSSSSQSGMDPFISPSWSTAPTLNIPPTEDGDALEAVIANLDESLNITQALPTPALRGTLTAAVQATIPGFESLNARDQEILESFCLHKRLTEASRTLLREAEAAEALIQPDESGDPLKGKSVEYSPNSYVYMSIPYRPRVVCSSHALAAR